jgi:hypothetical protein
MTYHVYYCAECNRIYFQSYNDRADLPVIYLGEL